MVTLEKGLFHLRPAPLAAWLKRFFRIQRRHLTTRDGLTFWIDPVSHLGRQLLDTGVYEPEMTQVIQTLLRPGDTFFDVGVNEGYFTCLAAQAVGPAGRVLGAEPQTRLIEIILRNINLNHFRNVDLEHTALSDAEGTATFYETPDINSGASSFFRPAKIGLRPVKVQTMRLDSLVEKSRLQRIRLMKIDCEGAEGAVLAGAHQTLSCQQIDYLVVEFHPQLTGEAVPHKIDAQLKAAGYTMSVLSNGIWIYHLPDLTVF